MGPRALRHGCSTTVPIGELPVWSYWKGSTAVPYNLEGALRPVRRGVIERQFCVRKAMDREICIEQYEL